MALENTLEAPVRIFSDDPAAENLAFGFDDYADALSGLVANKENATPMVMGVYGPWGSGKTTLMNAMKSRMSDQRFADGQLYRRCIPVWFQAWKCKRSEDILAAIVEAIFKVMAAHGFFTLAKKRVEAVTRRIDRSTIFTSVSKLATGADISEFFSQLPQKDDLGAYDTFFKFFDDLIWTFLSWRLKLSDSEKPDDKKGALAIFIDDLDRCPSAHILRALESIKLFMNRSGCIFVVGGARELFEDALAEAYSDTDAAQFLDKIVPTAFALPPIAAESIGAYLENLPGNVPGMAKYLPLVGPAVDYNPRQLKGFINKVNLQHGLLRQSNVAIGYDNVFCWGIIERCFSGLAGEIASDPRILFTLQKQIRQLMAKPDGKPIWQISDRRLKSEKVPVEIHAYLRQPYLADVVARLSISAADLQRLQAMSRAVRASGESVLCPPDESAPDSPASRD